MKVALFHGRQQQHKDPTEEQAVWIDSINEGMVGLYPKVALRDEDVNFAYYGDALHRLEEKLPAVEVIIRGDFDFDSQEARFVAQLLDEIAEGVSSEAGPYSQQLEPRSIDRGPLQNPQIRRVLQWLNDHVPAVGGAALFLFTHDVYSYIRNAAVNQLINDGVSRALDKSEPMIVIGHSLGSVVAYANIVRRDPSDGWRIPLFLTLGSPLGVRGVRASLPYRLYPPAVDRWLNVFDERDVVALRPLGSADYPLGARDPTPRAVENVAVLNSSNDNHGVAEYLKDPAVAVAIHKALTT